MLTAHAGGGKGGRGVVAESERSDYIELKYMYMQ